MDLEDWIAAGERVPGWTRGDEARELFRRAAALPEDAQIVEIGSFMGGGAVVLGGARSNAGSGKVHCVDPFDLSGDGYSVPFYQEIVARHGGQPLRATFDANMRALGLSDWVEVHQGRAVEIAARWSSPIDLLFLDGDQSPAGARAAYEAWVPFLKPGGVIAVHNSSPGLRALDHYGMVMIVGSLAFAETFRDASTVGTTTFATARDEPPARPARRGPGITFVQTCDPHVYYDLLTQSARTVREYCRRHGYRYESYVGVRRGDFAWQASFNHLHMLKDLSDRGQCGWAVYLDADAFVADLDMDLAAYLAGKADVAAIATPAHDHADWWDVNTGVIAFNLRHPLGRKLVEQWLDAFEMVYSDQVLARSEIVFTSPHDQDLFQAILRDHEAVFRPVLELDDGATFNTPRARLIRQMLSNLQPDLPARIDAMRHRADLLLESASDGATERGDEEKRQIDAFLVAAYDLILGRSIDEGGRVSYAAIMTTLGPFAGSLHVFRSLLTSDEYKRRSGEEARQLGEQDVA